VYGWVILLGRRTIDLSVLALPFTLGAFSGRQETIRPRYSDARIRLAPWHAILPQPRKGLREVRSDLTRGKIARVREMVLDCMGVRFRAIAGIGARTAGEQDSNGFDAALGGHVMQRRGVQTVVEVGDAGLRGPLQSMQARFGQSGQGGWRQRTPGHRKGGRHTACLLNPSVQY